MQLPIAGGSYTDMSIDINNQRCVNWFPASSGPYGRGNSSGDSPAKVLLPTQGTKGLTTLPGLSVRNMITVRDYVYVVVDQFVYKTKINDIAKTATWENIGQIGTNSGIVQSAFNPTQIMWVDGDGFLYIDSPILPTITLLSPSTANVNGGTLMTVVGTNFTPDTTIRFGPQAVTPVTFVDQNTLTFTLPGYNSSYNSSVNLEVNNTYASALLINAFTWTTTTPTLTGYIPLTGNLTAFNYFRIVGTQFGPNMVILVDGVSATDPRSNTTNGAAAWLQQSPTLGQKSIQVFNGGGSATLANGFTFNNTGAIVTAVSPLSSTALGGGIITVSGFNFTASYSLVYIGDQLCNNVTVVNSNTITAEIPPYFNGTLEKSVRVEQPSTLLNAGLYNVFTYIESVPTITSQSTSTGLISGNQPIVITGTGFNLNTTVTIGGITCPQIQLLGNSQIRVLTPPSPTNTYGTFPLVVQNNAGSVTGTPFTYTTGTFRQISTFDSNYPKNTFQVVYIGGYFVVACTGSQQMFASDINDGLSWNPLDTANAENSPDRIVALSVAKGEMWVFGEYSTEIWYQAGNPSGFPLSPRPSLAMQIGCAATQSVTTVNDLLVWVDNRGFIVQSAVSPYLRDTSSGYDLQIISTDAINQALLSYETLEDGIGMVYNDRGHIMYQITFPEAEKTWVFDYEMKEWHERLYYSETSQSLQRHLGQFCCRYKNLNLIGGDRSGIVYIQSPEYLDDDGRNIQRIRTTPFLYVKDDLKFITINAIKLRIGQIQPFPIIEGDDVPIQIGLRHSRNGGHSWSDRIFRTLGKRGKYHHVVVWNRVGNAREWILEFLISGKVSCSIVDAWLVTEAEQ